MGTPDLIPRHGGYRHLKSFQLAQLCYDLTAQFCDRYIPPRSRTHDQMVQAARSGVQNIAEGSQASGTSKKTELKLTNVARASLEELRLDYEDFLRQRGLEQWPPTHPILQRFKARRCSTVADVRHWIEAERAMARAGGTGTTTRTGTDFHGQPRTQSSNPTRSSAPASATPPAAAVPAASPQPTPPAPPPAPASQCPSVPVRVGPCSEIPSSAQLAANAVLSLLNLACHFLDRQLAAQAGAFTREGGFTERLYRTRSAARQGSPPRRT